MRKRSFARECALKILYMIEIAKERVDAAIGDFWSRERAGGDVKDFANSIVKGVYDNLSRIDDLISRYAENWELKRMAVIDKNILRMGIFEMLYREDIPHKVSINEAIEIAKKYGDKDSGKFVNGILDRVRKEECEIVDENKE